MDHDRTPRRAGLALAALLPVLGLVCIGWGIANDPVFRPGIIASAVMAAVVVPGVVGCLILRRRPGHPIGWLLCTHSALVGFALATPPKSNDDSTFDLTLGQLTLGAWVGLYVCLVFIAYLFPEGRPASTRWARWVWLCAAGYVAFAVGATGSKTEFTTQYPGHDPPLPVPPTWLSGTLGVGGYLIIVASLVGTVVSARARLRRATGDERLQLLWFAWGTVSIPAMLAAAWLTNLMTPNVGTLTVLSLSVGEMVIPVVIGIAILRFRLFDIELVLSRTLTYGALTVGVVGTYALALWLARSALDNESAAGLIGVGVVAVVVQPAHAFLRRRIERWVYGDRSDPVAALRRLSDRVERTTDPALVVQSVTDSVAEALRVDRAWVELARDGEPPLPGDHVVRVPLVHRGQRLGDLAVDVPLGRQLVPSDMNLLHDLARHTAVIVDSVHLTLDLQRSRARIVTTREEERRRLRRDLHDGLGPALAAVVLKLNAVESRNDAAERAGLLAEARAETKAAIDEVRRLVDDLRPPAIDEVGLIGAIRQRAASLSRDDLRFDVGGPAAMPALPAAVEVAAYRIATEAMTNVSRHAHASQCAAHLAIDGALELTITDNGNGAPLGTHQGVGWTSMAERAAELGGSCTISSRGTGGTVVRAVLPLPTGINDELEVPR